MWNRKKEDKRIVAELMALLQDEETDSKTKEEIRAWFWSKVNEEAKDATLAEQLSHLQINETPDLHDHKKYAELVARLNMTASDFKQVRKRRLNPVIRISMRVAAVLLLFVGIGQMVNLWINEAGDTTEPVVAEVIVTAGAAGRTITLPDGSTVNLSRNAEITYDENFTYGRHVNVIGEAVFDVIELLDESGERQPFTVNTDRFTVNVLGTVFRVFDPMNEDLSLIALYEGKVSIEAADTTIELKHGEKLDYFNASDNCEVTLISAEEMLDRGFMPLLRFDNSSLGNLITALEANYQIEFVLPQNTDLSQGGFSADLEGEPLENALSMLTKANKSYVFARHGNKIFVTSK